MELIDFNPRSREGSDNLYCRNDAGKNKFQSTLPRGERRFIIALVIIPDMISIHAPARGATLLCSVSIWLLEFQSTLPRGERRYARSFRL